MKNLLNPKLDLVFKYLFAQAPDILRDLVNCILVAPGRVPMTTIEVKNPTVLPEEIQEKFIVLDILATDEQNRHYDIEMQVRRDPAYGKRSAYYLCKLYAGQLKSGETYDALTPVIGIHFLDFNQFSNTEHTTIWQWLFEWRDRQHPNIRLTEDLSLYLFELRKFEKLHQSDAWGERLFEWLHFLNHAPEEGNEAMQHHYTNPVIQQAFQRLETLSADEHLRRVAEIRERALLYEGLSLTAAREEGREEGEIIGEIRALQRVLRRPVTSSDELSAKTSDERQELLEALRHKLPVEQENWREELNDTGVCV